MLAGLDCELVLGKCTGERVFVELVLQPERRPREVEFPLVVVFLVQLSVHWRLFLLERSMGQFLSR